MEAVAEKKTGSTLVKVAGIIMIVGGAISIITGIIRIVAMGVLAAVVAEYGISMGGLVFGCILAIVGAIAELIAGIVGAKNSAKPEKATAIMVWAIIVAVISILATIIVDVGSNALVASVPDAASALNTTGSTIISIVSGMVLPALMFVGALQLKKQA